MQLTVGQIIATFKIFISKWPSLYFTTGQQLQNKRRKQYKTKQIRRENKQPITGIILFNITVAFLIDNNLNIC